MSIFLQKKDRTLIAARVAAHLRGKVFGNGSDAANHILFFLE